MATALRLQYLIIVIGVSLHPISSHGFLHKFHESPYRGVKIVKHGEPCPTPYYLPVKIEVPARPVEETEPPKPYQPLKLSYQTFNPLPRPQYLHQEYPVSIEVPEVPLPEISTYVSLPMKSYEYNIQIPPPPIERIPTIYNFDLQALPPSPTVITPMEPLKFLTGLTSRIDRIVIPACEKPYCKIYEDYNYV
ncbi:uncharacterized protein LOC116848769 [Odontomachus brunneus]|uniref:uncharacterized protein LOC116848769 n=1 Tax=Odontomachus brunneus TaxID=486640 RepID=UPI0013F1DE87|nr:uncharacterized protein LOC116848769 [Odontomachus brunneus]